MAQNYTFVEGAAFPYQYKYPHMAVTTDCVIFTYEDRTLKVLLVRRGMEPFKGFWALPGGFLKLDETAREGALRELWEETALKASAVRELGVFSDPDRDPRERCITLAYYALVKPSEVTGGDDAEDAAWFPVDGLPGLAFDHGKIFEAAMDRLRRDIHFDPVGFDLLDETFTIPDLQRLYEIILGTTFDRRNFQRKVLSSGILEQVPREEEPLSEPVALFLDPEEYEDQSSCCDYVSFEPLAKIPAASGMVNPTFPAPKSAPAKEEKARKRPGRIASLFRFNKKKYDEMKEDGEKFEF